MASPHYLTPTANRVSVRIDGADWAVEMLKQMDFAIRRRCLSAAIRAANTVVVREARGRAPIGKTGELRKQIGGSVKMDRATGTVTGTVRAKASKKQMEKGRRNAAKYAHLVVGGTAPHVIERKPDGPMLPVGGNFYTRIEHPGAKPRPFLEEAAAASFKFAISAFESKLEERINVEQTKLKAKSAASTASMAAMRDFF